MLAAAPEETVFCLSIDLTGSTRRGLELSQSELNHFNQQLVRQMTPHLTGLGLLQALLKFTGDGWLVVVKTAQLRCLCCLALIQAQKFQSEMAALTYTQIERIPPARLAICSGADIEVPLPDSRSDWVGDSVRRSVRLTGYCEQRRSDEPKEILVDGTVKGHVFRDFTFSDPLDLTKRTPAGKPLEEKLTIFQLLSLTAAATSAAAHVTCYVYTLGALGDESGAAESAGRAAIQLAAEVHARVNQLVASLPNYAAAAELMRSARAWGLTPNVVTYNTLINMAPDYETAGTVLDEMRTQGLAPDVITYSTLIKKAPAADYQAALQLFDQMRAEGIAPNVITYSTLIAHAPDYETARRLLEEMRTLKVVPNAVTYNTLINMAPDYETAGTVLDEMRTLGLAPDVITYSTLLKKAPDYQAALQLFDQMRAEGIAPNVITYSTLVDRAPDYETARGWLERMRAEGIAPNVITYSTLVDRAPDYETARGWLERMRAEGVAPNVITYTMLFHKDLRDVSAEDLLNWYLSQPRHPEEPVQAAIATYRRTYRIRDALRLALEYPHLDASRKLVRENRNEAIEYFTSVFERDRLHPNASYALGLSLLEIGQLRDAIPYLRQAIDLATSSARRSVLAKRLHELEGERR